MSGRILARCPIHRDAECWWNVTDAEGLQQYFDHLIRHSNADVRAIVQAIIREMKDDDIQEVE